MDNTNDVSERGFGEVEERETDESTQTESEQTGEEVSSEQPEVTKAKPEEQSESKEEVKEESEEEQVKYTDKGTKLDPNPKSAVHQELANSKRLLQQMEQVFTSPELLSKYMEQQYGIKTVKPEKTETKVEEAPAKKYTAEDFENIDDIASKFNELQEGFSVKSKQYEEQIKTLATALTGLLETGRNEQFISKLSSNISDLKQEKELDPKSPEYIEGLESDIVSLYHKLDFDSNTGVYRGQYSIAEIGKQIIEAARKARVKGSQQAQTVIKQKTEGRVRTSQAVKEDAGEDSLSAGDSIAKGISRVFK